MRDWRDLALQCALEAGAVQRCAFHPDVLLIVEPVDGEDPQTKGWFLLVEEAKLQGFDGDADRYLQPDYIYTLQSADDSCPKCASAGS